MTEKPTEQPPAESAMERKKSTADVVSFLRDKVGEMRQEWDQPYETETVPGRPEDWQDQLAQIDNAITQLEQGNTTTARVLLDSYIYEAQRALEGRSLDNVGLLERERVRQRRQKRLEELEALRRAIG